MAELTPAQIATFVNWWSSVTNTTPVVMDFGTHAVIKSVDAGDTLTGSVAFDQGDGQGTKTGKI